MAQNGTRLLKIIFILLVVVLLMNMYLILDYNASLLPLATIRPSTLLINTQGCQIPKLDPMHFSVKSMVDHPKPLNCTQKMSSWIHPSSDPRYPCVKINLEKINESNIACSYKAIRRVHETKSVLDSKSHPLSSTITNITDEFIRVDCVNNINKTVHFDYFPFIQRKPNTEKRCELVKKLKTFSTQDERLNILLLGIDSMSRNQFLRHMKKTYEYIKERLDYVELFGYNKIGVNTYPNMIAMLTGLLQSEVADTSKVYANSLPLIWNDFMKAGYRTLFAEDIPTISTFNYAKKGFDAEPTDYYLRTFSVAAEDTVVKKGKEGCFKDRIENDVILKWTLDLFRVFPEDPLFVLTFLTRLSHDMFNGIAHNDAPLARFFKQLRDQGHLNRTIVFFFGDHGFRFGKIRSTYVGRLEDKLPFAMFLIPGWFRNKYLHQYSNVCSNRYRLTTPLDIYATLRHFLKFTKKPARATNLRSVNLFGNTVSESRTCEEAEIPIEYCSCIRLQQTKKSDETVIKAAGKLIEAVNGVVKQNQSMCEIFMLDEIEEAAVQTLRLGETPHDKDSSNYRITIKVKPGGATFEGMVWHYAESDSYSVHSNIERVDFYGNQSYCIDIAKLKPFCYCKKQ